MATKSKKSKKSNKFLSGALVGAALGVAAAVFAGTKTGKKVIKETKDKTVDFYKYLTPQLKKLKEVGEGEYKDLIEKALLAYGKAKKLDKKDMDDLAKEVRSSWKQIMKHF